MKNTYSFLETGHTYALIGPNGSGKTTLMRILAGATDAAEGALRVACAEHGQGEDGVGQGLSIGYMPQKSYVFGFSVYRNVELALKGRHLGEAEIAARVKHGQTHG